MSHNGYLQVTTAIDTDDGAQRLAQSAVEACLAAGVQVIGPIRSTYRWRGAIQSTQEWLQGPGVLSICPVGEVGPGGVGW